MDHAASAVYADGVLWNAPLPAPQPVEQWLLDTVARWPERKVVDYYGTTLTYAQLAQVASRVAAGLQALGVGKGVCVGLHLANTPHYVACFFGVFLAGGYVANLSPAWSERQLRQQMRHAEVAVLITSAESARHAATRTILDDGLVGHLVVCSGSDLLHDAGSQNAPGTCSGEIDFSSLIDNHGEYERSLHGSLDAEIAVIQYTGGTTGDPKAAIVTHANCSALVAMAGQFVPQSQQPQRRLDTAPAPQVQRRLVVVPFSHTYGFGAVLLCSVARGSELVLHRSFEAGAALSDIERKQITGFAGVPSMYAALVDHPRFAGANLSSLRSLVCSGAPLSASIRSTMETRTGLRILEGYGLTETMGVATHQSLARTHLAGSVGVPFPHAKIDIVDLDTGLQVLGAGEIGEICVSGPQVISRYWKNDDANGVAFRGGRFHTGDIGRVDEHGHLRLVDRKKDMLCCGGYKVFPRIVEVGIEEHPGVREAAVIGTPDRIAGEKVKAFITMRPGSTDLTLRELRAFLADRLASYELPSSLQVIAELPRTPAGKLWKQPLIDAEAAGD